MTLQTIKTPGVETLVVLTAAEYEDLLDAGDVAEHVRAMAPINRGEMEMLTEPRCCAPLRPQPPSPSGAKSAG